MGRVGVDDLEALQSLKTGRAEQGELLEKQTECTFVFANEHGWPSGVIMSFFVEDGTFWLTAVESRPHARALAADPRVTIVVSNSGTGTPGRQMLAIRGVATVHRDAKTKEWFFEKFTTRMQPEDPAAFTRLLDSPNRVVFEVRSVATAVSHDSRKMPGNGRGGKRAE
ncbi:pyridoxamine 5'-phosphate oxidase family protein [Streptosporangium sp. NPDC006013]|uniref:pyridoxamine 5'-phosphate oxidase family protein n=1 Tax=Streptosporangium sp. NPDC006013 TaxID=3155596 RepID=UPI0033B03030